MLEIVPDATVVADSRGRIRLVNRLAEELFGYAREDLLGRPIERLIPDRFHRAHQAHRSGYRAAPHTRPMGVSLPLFGRRQDGSEFPAAVSLAPLADEGATFVMASIRDVSDLQGIRAAQISAEEANQELLRLQALTDTALAHLDLDDLLPTLLPRVRDVLQADHVTILLLEADGQTLAVRAELHLAGAVPAWERVPVGVGFAGRVAASRESLIVEDLSRFPLVRPQLRQTLRSAVGVPLLAGEELLGVLCVGSAQAHHFSPPDAALLERAAERITAAIERAHLFAAEQAARQQTEGERVRWQTAMESMPELVITCDAYGRITYVNPAYARLRGGPADPAVPVEERPDRYGLYRPNGVDLFTAEDLPLARAVRRGRPIHGAEMRVRPPDGAERLVVWEAAPMRSPQGVLLGAVAVGHDITERRQLEHAREQARVEAERQAEQLDRIVEAMADGVTVWDATGQLVRTNAALRRMLALDAAPPDYFQQPPNERVALYAPRDEQGHLLAAADWPVTRALRGEVLTGSLAVDLRMQSFDGRDLVVTSSAAPLRDQEGHVVGAVGVLRDQTERRQLEREREAALRASEEWFRTIADTAPVLLWVADTEGLATFVNARWLQFTGRTLEQELGIGWAKAIHPDDSARCLETFRAAVQAHQPFTLEFRVRRFDGEYRWVVDSGVPRVAPDGTFAGYIGSIIDVTEREQLKQEREAALASELAMREVNERLDTFVATAAHDLRQPITASKMAVEMAQRRIQQAAATVHGAAKQALPFIQVERDLDTMQRNLDRLWRLIHQLLDMTRAKQGNLVLNRQSMDLAALVRAAVEEQRLLAPGHTLTLELPDPDLSPAMVHADPDRLSQVLSNYLSNAVRYSPEDQPIVVTLHLVEPAPEDGGGVVARVAVRDRGPGIAPEEQATIWDRFQRAHSAREAKGGLGLGLYIARTLIELHGGQIGVDSTVGEGSTFWFTLPLGPAST
jgi:PAS domain S-box-containing protein